MTLGNPAPLGLLAFGMTTAMLMFVDTGWVEESFTVWVFGYAVFFGGLMQVLVAIFEIIKGQTFSFAVFGSYGAFWLGWAIVLLESHRDFSDFGDATYQKGLSAFFFQWGLLTACFFVITLRKNICLIIIFVLLTLTFILLGAATAASSTACRKAAGYVGFLTAFGAFYTGVAELINEEWGRPILPGLTPIHLPERFAITRESIVKRTSYDGRTNTLLLHFRGMQIKTDHDVEAIVQGVEDAILAAKAPDNKVHVVVDYKDVFISDDIYGEYWAEVAELERKYYLSVKRFHVTSFGTSTDGNHSSHRMRKASDVHSLHGIGSMKHAVSNSEQARTNHSIGSGDVSKTAS